MADRGGGGFLIVDADDAFRASIVRVLKRAGLSASEAAGGEEALEIATERPAAVILEVDLPDMDGFEVLRLLAQGLRADAIAEQLVIAPKTVASHLQRVMAKLGVHSRAQAVAEAYRLGVVNGDFEGHALDDGSGSVTDEGRLSPPPVVVR